MEHCTNCYRFTKLKPHQLITNQVKYALQTLDFTPLQCSSAAELQQGTVAQLQYYNTAQCTVAQLQYCSTAEQQSSALQCSSAAMLHCSITALQSTKRAAVEAQLQLQQPRLHQVTYFCTTILHQLSGSSKNLHYRYRPGHRSFLCSYKFARPTVKISVAYFSAQREGAWV